MTERFTIPLDELERTVRVAGAAQVEVQAEPRLSEAPFSLVPPFGDGGGGGCADGE